MSNPTRYYTQQVHDEFTRVPPPVTVPQPKTARRVNLILLAAMCAGLAAVLAIWWMQS